MDSQGHVGGQGVHVEEVDGVGDDVFDAACISVDEAGGGFLHLVGEEQGGFFVSEVGDGDLADPGGAGLEIDLLFEDARVAVGASDVGERDPAPP